jgi:hypothetical protein
MMEKYKRKQHDLTMKHKHLASPLIDVVFAQVWSCRLKNRVHLQPCRQT